MPSQAYSLDGGHRSGALKRGERSVGSPKSKVLGPKFEVREDGGEVGGEEKG
jgi:hypothetical protein